MGFYNAQKGARMLKVLSAKSYSDQSKNYGDCTLIEIDNQLFIYDCGSKEHAVRVEQYMKEQNHKQAVGILSHNDADHFDGFPYLISKGLISKVHVQLLSEHASDIMDFLDDDRFTEKSVSNRIKDVFNNIEQLKESVEVQDAIENHEISPSITIVGPSQEYIKKAVAKEIIPSEGDSLNGETIINAISMQLCVTLENGKHCLLTGDACYEAISNNITDKEILQLPHHGKSAIARQIFDQLENNNDIKYFISDNTGSSNGGSDGRCLKGHDVETTKENDIKFPKTSPRFVGCLG